MTAPDSGLNVAAELANLRGDMMAGFARLEGRLDLMAQAQNTTAQDVKDLERNLEALEGRVASLEARRWPLGPMAAVSGAVSAVVAVAAFLFNQ